MREGSEYASESPAPGKGGYVRGKLVALLTIVLIMATLLTISFAVDSGENRSVFLTRRALIAAKIRLW